jgi:hypothetical protein
MATMTLDELVRQMSLVHGDALRCMALYGSTVRGETDGPELSNTDSSENQYAMA